MNDLPGPLPGPLPEVRLSPLAYTFGHWMPRQDHEHIDLNPPYQRGSVWSVEQRRALVKSLIMGIPIGSLIVSVQPETSEVHYRVVDGKQRIEACRAWATDEFGVPGWWFQSENVSDRSLTEVRWSDMSERGRRHFDMSVHVPALEFRGVIEYLRPDPDPKKGWITRRRTDAELLVVEAEVYALVNGGGTPQTPEDMARAAAIARA